jgi:hypothetical protein
VAAVRPRPLPTWLPSTPPTTAPAAVPRPTPPCSRGTVSIDWTTPYPDALLVEPAVTGTESEDEADVRFVLPHPASAKTIVPTKTNFSFSFHMMISLLIASPCSMHTCVDAA